MILDRFTPDPPTFERDRTRVAAFVDLLSGRLWHSAATRNLLQRARSHLVLKSRSRGQSDLTAVLPYPKEEVKMNEIPSFPIPPFPYDPSHPEAVKLTEISPATLDTVAAEFEKRGFTLGSDGHYHPPEPARGRKER